ncbi:MAG: membrane protein insertase YidC [Phycisphaerae bacterium]|nr:membrane protein insertase YidC [Phycisphaerae bacterium]
MSSDARRMLLFTALCLILLIGWTELQRRLYPPPPPAPAAPTIQTAVAPTVQPAPSPASAAAAPASAGRAPTSPAEFAATSARVTEPIPLGIDAPRGANVNPYVIALQLSPIGAAIEAADLTDARNHPPRKDSPPDTYDLMRPILDPASGRTFRAMASERVLLVEENAEIRLDNVTWQVEREPREKGESATFQTTITRDGLPILRLRKRFELAHDSRMIRLTTAIDNLSDAARTVVLTQGGPLGLRVEELRADDRYAYVQRGDRIETPLARHKVFAEEDHQKSFLPEGNPIGWAAIGNKYFACMMAPARRDASPSSDFIKKVTTRTLLATSAADAGDLTVEWAVSPAAPLAPRGSFECAFDIYLGPRSESVILAEPAAAAHHFELISQADQSSCTFTWLARLMQRLFSLLHRVLPGTHNYGWAIIVLVLIVRTILHPVTKKAQINMARMQKGMAGIQPKLEELKRKYANDRQALNQATLQLYREEGVNPAGNLMSCLPLMLQMPVWVALWSTLNTTFELRHEPFVLWIRDLSAPDAIYAFGRAIHVPLLDALMGPISSINILPIFMGLTMYLQQKYTQKLTRANAPPTPPPTSEPGRPSPADQIAMQQKMMNFMTIFFALMFYNFPSGLSLYILTSNLFGMIEQKRIRTHMQRDEERKKFQPPSDNGRGRRSFGWLDRLQKMADESKQIRSRPARR